MKILIASYSKGQIKIQQMAFVLVALMIFLALVALIYISFRVENIKGDVEDLGDQEARELARKLSGTPEFAFTAEDCSDCIDLDKVLVLKERKTYKDFWNLDYLQVERVYPKGDGECTKANYPNCGTITIIDDEVWTPAQAFVSLCRWEDSKGGYFRCELGRIYASGDLGNG